MHISSSQHVSCPPYVIGWLRFCIILVLLMVAIGGLTRLTESGLSIVEWKLMSGILPPLTEAGWQETFTDYQSTPEFIKKNSYMELSDFKRIYWLEYIHRLLGRFIGLAVLLPLIIITIKRDIPKPWGRRLWGIFALICVQGGIGWYMVKSGLVHDPWVSPYRLAFHLSLATVILGALYLCLKGLRERFVGRSHGKLVLGIIGVQIIWGAFVAGLDAGLIYNSFPLMDGVFMPDELFSGSPMIVSIFEHHATVQFVHRWFAFVVLAVIIMQYVKRRTAEAAWVCAIAMIQVLFGIATLLSVVDITLASIHQLVAMFLVLAQLRLIIHSRRGTKSDMSAS